MNQEKEQLVVDRKEAARRLHVSVSTIDRLISEGEIEVIRIGKRCTRISVAEIDRFIESKRTRQQTTHPDIARSPGHIGAQISNS